jgi:hypothetical protein
MNLTPQALRILESPETVEASARHEAGHAVFAALLGYPVIESYVTQRAGSPETTGVVYWDTQRFGAYRGNPQHLRWVTLAGPLAALAGGPASWLALPHHRRELLRGSSLQELTTDEALVRRAMPSLRFVLRAVAALLAGRLGESVSGREVCATILQALGGCGTIRGSLIRGYRRLIPGWHIPQVRGATLGYWLDSSAVRAPLRKQKAVA